MKTNEELLTYTESQMLDLWKMRLNLTQARRDCQIERDDGIDLNARLLTDIRQWYATLLATAPVEWLPVEDLAAEVQGYTDASGMLTVPIPERCVRPVEWHAEGWKQPVAAFHAPDSHEARRQQVEWLRGCPNRPVAVLAATELRFYTVTTGSAIDRAICVVRPADGTYRFSPQALPIPQPSIL